MEFETENALRAWAFRKKGLLEKPRPAASDRVVYLAVAPPIEPVIYSKEIFIPSDLILMIINLPRPLSVPLSGVYSRSWRLKLICTVSPCRFSGHIPRHLRRKRQRQKVAGSECTWFRLWVTVKGVSKSKCSWFSYKGHLFHCCITTIEAFLMLRYRMMLMEWTFTQQIVWLNCTKPLQLDFYGINGSTKNL